MAINKASCENCGGVLVSVDDKNYQCENCGTLYVLQDDIMQVKNVNNVVNNYYGNSASKKMDDDKCNAYLDLALSDIISGDISSARDYCVKILNKNPENKTVAKLKAVLDKLKQSNGRYKKFDSAGNVVDFIDEIFNAEILYKDQKIVDFCVELLNFNEELSNSSIYCTKIKSLELKISTINYNNKNNNLDYSALDDCITEWSRNAFDYKQYQKSESILKVFRPVFWFFVIMLAIFLFSRCAKK